MGLFTRKKDVDEKESKDVKKTVAKKNTKVSGVKNKEVKKASKKSNNNVVSIVASKEAYKFIVSPWITEKTQELMTEGKYVFKIRRKVTKGQVKTAIEKMYGVKIIKINVINIPQKKRRFGRIIGKKASVRKAIVSLKKGDKIEMFK